ncbi:hypothetical protein POTOM_006048 [Populus tomentosa]|uniref:Histone chaperone domain-containing protein n=1 Tax=Populus tomentosa TaxID=118781 RepID=A0A8X8AMI8_POPTO|nr:hypothetical protein POTOM_006048 [Populus tomentosa]
MAETETQNEPTLPAKRKLDDDPIPENDQEQDNHSNKSQKIDSLSNNSPVIQEKLTENSQAQEHSIDSQNDIVQEGEDEDGNRSNKSPKIDSLANNSPIIREKLTENSQTLEPSIDNLNDTVQEGEDENEDEDEDGEEEDGDYEDEEENREEAVVDRKGKGIMIEEGDDDDDDGSELEGGDDSEEAEEDDPLAEVDLDNILPSRTRRKVVHPGVYISAAAAADDDDMVKRYGYLCVVSWAASTLGKLLWGAPIWFALFVSYNGWVNVTYKVLSGMDTDTLFTTPPRSWFEGLSLGSTSGNMAGGRPIVPTSVGLDTNHPDHSYKISLLPDFSTRDCTGSHNDSVRRQCVEQLHGPHNCTVLKHEARRIMLSWGANLSPGRLVQSMITKLPVLRSLLYFKVLP